MDFSENLKHNTVNPIAQFTFRIRDSKCVFSPLVYGIVFEQPANNLSLELKGQFLQLSLISIIVRIMMYYRQRFRPLHEFGLINEFRLVFNHDVVWTLNFLVQACLFICPDGIGKLLMLFIHIIMWLEIGVSLSRTQREIDRAREDFFKWSKEQIEADYQASIEAISRLHSVCENKRIVVEYEREIEKQERKQQKIAARLEWMRELPFYGFLIPQFP